MSIPKPTGTPRVEPIAPPYPPEIQAVFDKIMPRGVPPLTLFTTLARVPRIYDRFRAGSLLDRGPVSLRHREMVDSAAPPLVQRRTSGGKPTRWRVRGHSRCLGIADSMFNLPLTVKAVGCPRQR